MTIEEVKQLLDAGFSKDEIMSFNQEPHEVKTEHSEPEPEKDTENTPAAAQEPEEKTADQTDAKPENPNNPDFDKLTDTINKLIKTIQTSNLQNNFTGSAGNVDINKEVDNIMKSIIRPEKKGE